jgi:hypothetical protein
MSDGDDTLWIVDFKTGNRTGTLKQQDAFLAEERAKYEGQLRAYAEVRLRGGSGFKVMLGLFYPLMGRMISWPYDQALEPAGVKADSTPEKVREQMSLFG